MSHHHGGGRDHHRGGGGLSHHHGFRGGSDSGTHQTDDFGGEVDAFVVMMSSFKGTSGTHQKKDHEQ